MNIFDNTYEITISIVTYNSANEISVLLDSLYNCLFFERICVYVVDNNSKDETVSLIKSKYPWVNIMENKKNIGFGKGHNCVIRNVKSKYHIIVNPDISIQKDSISKAIEYLDNNPDIVVLTPYVMNEDGSQQFLPKKNPSFKYMLGGMFDKKNKYCRKLRDEYTLKNVIVNEPIDVDFCTGAFMVTRTNALQLVNGFDERYFLHFEDADLTRELKKVGRAVYNPNIKVTHKWHRDNKKLNKSFMIALKSMFIYFLKWSGK